MVLGRNVERTRPRTRMTTLPFLLLASYSFVIFNSDYALISCPLCKSNIFWNIFMIVGRNREQDNTTCRVQKMTNLAFLLLELSPFVLFEKDFVSATRIPF